MLMNKKLNGQVAIVTGAASGIGSVLAKRLSSEGATVIIADLLEAGEVVTEIRRDGAEAFEIQTDVSNEDSVEAMVTKTVDRYLKLDILVNNAAIFHDLTKPFDQITREEWDRVMNVNARGMFLCAKAVLPIMKKQRRGKIVNMGSTAFSQGTSNMLHYIASKGAAVGITRGLARELGQYGINVNMVSPGLTFTQAYSERKEHYDAAANSVIPKRSLKREQIPEDLSGTVAFLCSSDSDFITGQIINVDGGMVMT